MFLLFFWQGKQNRPIGCRIHTDVGIRGDGEAGMAYGVGGSGVFGMVCDLAELIIGMDSHASSTVNSNRWIRPSR